MGQTILRNEKNPYEEIMELLKEGKELEKRLPLIKKRLKHLAKLTKLTIDLDKWEVKPNEY